MSGWIFPGRWCCSEIQHQKAMIPFNPPVPLFSGHFPRMGEKIKRHFVEDRVVVIDPLPFTWRVKGPGPHYCLDMKMSRLKQLAFAFEFGSVDPR